MKIKKLMFGPTPGIVQFAFFLIVVLAIKRAWQTYFAGRRQWSIADWLSATFWLAIILAVFVNR